MTTYTEVPTMKAFARLAVLGSVALTLTACVTMSVSSSLQRGADLSQYRTWEWGPADAFPVGDARLDNNTIFKDRLEGALEKALAGRRLQRAATGASPDIIVHYHANVSQRFQVNEVEGNCAGVDCRPGVIEYEQGTLVIDLMDAKTNKLLWRGWAQDSVQGVIDNQDLLDRKVDEAVRKMIALLPPAL